MFQIYLTKDQGTRQELIAVTMTEAWAAVLVFRAFLACDTYRGEYVVVVRNGREVRPLRPSMRHVVENQCTT